MELNLVQKQTQTLSPMMVQSMEILQMGAQELTEFVDKTLQENPVLEREEQFHSVGRTWNFCGGSWSGWRVMTGRIRPTISRMTRTRPYRISAWTQGKRRLSMPTSSSSFRAWIWNPRSVRGSSSWPESLGQSGWLDEPLEALAQGAGLPQATIERALEVLQSMDPLGVGARNLSECLCIQLRARYPLDMLALRIAQECLEPLARNQYGLIARRVGADAQKVRTACDRIRTLNPRPGAGYAGREAPHYITPDLQVVLEYDHFEVYPNGRCFPELSLSSYYTRTLRENSEQEVQTYLADKVRQAKWVIRSIEQRRSTLLDCAKCILRLQEDFFPPWTGTSSPHVPLRRGLRGGRP